MARLNGNSGYVFEGNFDVFLYMVLSVIYPILGFYSELRQINVENVVECYEALITAFLFAATFFYDFYARFRDCGGKTRCIVEVLFWGRNIFCVVTLIIFLTICFLPTGYITGEAIKNGFYIVLVMSFYPCIMGFIEIISRVNNERLGKISQAGA